MKKRVIKHETGVVEIYEFPPLPKRPTLGDVFKNVFEGKHTITSLEEYTERIDRARLDKKIIERAKHLRLKKDE